jgi:hypothetical protein
VPKRQPPASPPPLGVNERALLRDVAAVDHQLGAGNERRFV